MSKCTAEKITKCAEDNKICNPATGRCVKKDGKIGKELIKAKKSKSKKSKKSKSRSKSKSKKKMTIKEKIEECKKKGLVYDRETGKCRPSKRGKKPAKKPDRRQENLDNRPVIIERERVENEPDENTINDYHSIIMDYINGDDKAINKLTVQRRNGLLHSVKFHGTKFGRVEYFKKHLEKHLGAKWSKRVLDSNDDLSDIPSVKRLGVPGRQGTTIQLHCDDGNNYAVKVTRKGTSCGDGATGGMGFLKQARMQELAAQYDVTCHVEAVYCGHKKDVSFMVMPVFKDRFVDRYRKGSTVSLKHQKQLWNLYLKLDSYVGIIHNDMNCLNVMIDFKDNVKLIDFDRSVVTEKKHIKKWGCYPNLYFLSILNCFRMYAIEPGSWLGPKIESMDKPDPHRYIIEPATYADVEGAGDAGDAGGDGFGGFLGWFRF
jgi:hypothetical protein